MKYILNVGLLLFIFLCSPGTLAQDKMEAEKRISQVSFPDAALAYLSPIITKTNRIKYYFETDGTRSSYEAKFKLNGLKHSVEFDEKGQLEDIEIDVKIKRIDYLLRDVITHWLDGQFTKWRIEKFQLQYLPDDKGNLLMRMESGEKNLPAPNFEIIVMTKENGSVNQYELLFDWEGNFVNKRKVVRRVYDFVLF